MTNELFNLSSFDEIAIAYDNAIDWKSRLGREIPFILRSISDADPARVLDIACGSGRHSIELSKHGLEVIGFDSSKSMIDEAARLAKEAQVTPTFKIGQMENIGEVVDGRFDLVICLGNSLALLENSEKLSSLIREIHSFLSANRVFVFQVLNFHNIIKSNFKYFPLKGGTTKSGKDIIFARFFDHSVSDEYSTLIMTSFVKEGYEWHSSISTQQVLRLDRNTLDSALSRAGFSKIDFFSDYAGTQFSEDSDRSIVVRASK